MRGFHPAGHVSRTQNFADGGLVSRIKGAMGFGRKQARKTPDEDQPADSTGQRPAPKPAPEPKTALGQYGAMSARMRQLKEIEDYANGGPVRGPGTGTSDEVPDEVPQGTYIMPADSTQAIGEENLAGMGSGIPVNLSNGEFKLPPEQVHAVGVQALDQMRDATHAPVPSRGFAPGAQPPDEPRMFFANGGVVDDEDRPPVAPGFMPGTRAVINEGGREIGDLVNQGRYGAAVGQVARNIPTAVVAIADDVFGPPARAISSGVADASRQFLGVNDTQAAPMPAAKAPPAVPAQPDAPAAAPAAAPVPAAAAAAQDPSATQIAPGVFRSGNSYAGSPEAAIAGAQPRGFVSAQNSAAADALAARSRQDAMAGPVAAPAVGIPSQPDVQQQSLAPDPDPAKARERRDLVRALTTPVQGARGLTSAQRNGMITLMNNEAQREQAAARDDTALQQTRMQTGTQRDVAAMREIGDSGRAQARNAIDWGRLGLDEQVKGFDIRAGQRHESLAQKYEAAKTPEERESIAQQIRDLSGKQSAQANRFTVVPGGQEWDATAGTMRNVPARVLNNQTGQFIDQPVGGNQRPAGVPKIGETRNGYRYKGGNPNVQANWEKV